MKYHLPALVAAVPSRGTKPNKRSTLPITQKPVKETPMDATPVAITRNTQRGSTIAASTVAASSTMPAINHTVRSMYHSLVGTM
jgi:hypothetical protein